MNFKNVDPDFQGTTPEGAMFKIFTIGPIEDSQYFHGIFLQYMEDSEDWIESCYAIEGKISEKLLEFESKNIFEGDFHQLFSFRVTKKGFSIGRSQLLVTNEKGKYIYPQRKGYTIQKC